jgi:phospholipid/cholesterol/gamma-HCH transport system ATP-binding protein
VSAPRGVAVALRGVTKRYGDTPVLAGVDLDVAAGELVAILGQSGQGKSVLLRLVAGLEDASGGRVLVGGLDVAAYRALPADRKPFRLAMVFQNAALLGALTVAENVGLRLREHGADAASTRDVTADVLARVDLADAADKRPAALSGGMRKRAAIARALAVAPHLILYDEPTADLDPILTEQIARLIRRIRDERGATQIVVTHHVPLACAVADRIAVLDGGRIVDHGPPAAILASRNPVTRAFVRASTIAPTSAEVSC